MGFFEFFGERFNPGNIGEIETGEQPSIDRSLGKLIFKTVFSAAILIGIYALTVGWKLHLKGILIYIGVMLGYCLISYSVTPKPDYSNVGWLGGLMDHPFRYSDDLNRMLVFLLVLLAPGKLISTTVVSWIWWMRYWRSLSRSGNEDREKPSRR